MIDTKLLRQKILDLAIRGKLVPQNPADEPASELLKKIKAEKEALVKAGKIKKDKHESFIFQGDDKRYYEQIDGKNIDISGEIPFELPEGWAWCRMQNVTRQITDGEHLTPKREENYSGYYLISARNVLNTGLDLSVVDFVSQETYELLAIRCAPQIGDILLSCSGSVGRCCVCDVSNCVMVRSVALIAPLTMSSLYLRYVIQSLAVQKQIQKKQKQVAQANIFQAEIKALLFPLPPLAEQKRIVAQIESLLKCVDEIDRELETLEKSISLAKQKVLDLAIRGKLVPQNPEDEPASELMKRIKAEKEALVKAGKLKKNKHESFIFKGDDNCYHENIDGKSSDITGEIPFELPQSWILCRIGNIGTINPRNHVADDSTMVSFMPMTQLEGGYGSNYTRSERTWQDVKTGFTHIQENDVVFAKITPCFQNRKSAIMRGLKNGYGAGTTELHVIRCFFPVFPEYILWFLKNQTFISDAVSTIQGVVGQQRIDANFIRNYLLPLPPLSEQKRIVAQVEKLLSVLETMRG